MQALEETWSIQNRVNLYLLDAIPEMQLELAPAKGRSVGEQFAHIHNVRLMWLKAAAPALMSGIEKLEDGGTDKAAVRSALDASGKAIGQLLAQCGTDGKIKGFKPHATAFLGYLCAHEGHHRGQVLQTLRLAGKPVDKKIGYGVWEWGVR